MQKSAKDEEKEENKVKQQQNSINISNLTKKIINIK